MAAMGPTPGGGDSFPSGSSSGDSARASASGFGVRAGSIMVSPGARMVTGIARARDPIWYRLAHRARASERWLALEPPQARQEIRGRPLAQHRRGELQI